MLSNIQTLHETEHNLLVCIMVYGVEWIIFAILFTTERMGFSGNYTFDHMRYIRMYVLHI